LGGRAGISTSREEHPDAPRSVQSTAGQAQAVSVGLDEGQLGDVHDAATPKDAVPATAVAVDFEHRFARVQLGTSDGTAEIGAVGYRFSTPSGSVVGGAGGVDGWVVTVVGGAGGAVVSGSLVSDVLAGRTLWAAACCTAGGWTVVVVASG